MLNFETGRRLLKRFKNNEDGNIALTFAVSTVAVIGCMGAAMDYSTLSNAEARSQSIADQTALSAAVFVKTYGRQPKPAVGTEDGESSESNTPQSDEGYLDKRFRTYTANELGYKFKGWVIGGAENVDVEISYDDINKEARVRVAGKTKPTFMQIFGNKDLEFAAQATAKYADYDLYDPASVLMVLDNSGSMSFDDKPRFYDALDLQWKDEEDVRPRIEALIEHSKNFYTKLFAMVGNQENDNKKVLRTGMLAYNSNNLSARSVAMNWSIQSSVNSLNNMVASGGTNSAPSLATARSWMAGEDKNHENMHGEKPLKFVVFMSDGLNTTGGSTWIEEEGTGQWYGQRCIRYRRNGSCRKYDYDTVESEDKPNFGFNWQEGKWVSSANLNSLTDCAAMKNEGVKVYTIGFALSEGWYDTNEYFGYEAYEYIDTETRDKAYSFLTQCASEPETFLTAENAEELEEAFERIGNDVATEIIRLSN